MAKKAKSASNSVGKAAGKSSGKSAGKSTDKAAGKSSDKSSDKSTGKPQSKSVPKPLAKGAPKAVAKAVVSGSPTAKKNAAKPLVKSLAKSPAKATGKPHAKPAQVEPKSLATKSPAVKKSKPVAAKPVQKAAVDAMEPLEPDDHEMIEDLVGIPELDELDLDESLAEATTVVPAAKKIKPAQSAKEKLSEKRAKKKEAALIDRAGDILAQWEMLRDRSKNTKGVPYKMSESYEAKTALEHKVLGWGYVLSSVNNRLEVLFATGIKFLIANYKSS